MKKEKAQKSAVNPTDWITIKQVMDIIHATSRNGVKSFAIRHNIRVNKGTGKLLFAKHEIYDALEKGAVALGL